MFKRPSIRSRRATRHFFQQTVHCRNWLSADLKASICCFCCVLTVDAPSTIIRMSMQICTHFQKLTDLSLPMIVNALIQEAQYTSTMIFVGVGQLGQANYLGAATLGNMLCNITGYSLAFGLCSALDTLVAQAYGAKAYPLIGLQAQRAALIMSLFAIPVAFVWWQTDYIVHYALGINSEISHLAGVWARWILLGLWPTLMFQVLRKLLQGCGIIWPVIVSSVCSTIANIVSSYVMIYVLKWGFVGAAISVGVAQWAGMISLALVIVFQVTCLRRDGSGQQNDVEMSALHGVKFTPLSQDDDTTCGATDPESGLDEVSLTDDGTKEDEQTQQNAKVRVPAGKTGNHSENNHSQSITGYIYALQQSFIPHFPLHEAFPAYSPHVWENWGVFLELGMPGALSLFLEWGSYEAMAMISGKLGTVALATHGVFMTTCAIIYMVPQAIADATAVIAGNFLGQGDAVQAKSVIALGACYDMSIGLCGASLLLFVLRPYWGPIFTSDPTVQASVYHTLPIMFIYISVDSMKCITLNVLRSTGRPQVTMVGNIFCCACIMLPLGWYLALDRGWGLWGVWGSMSLGWAAATVVYATVLWFTDWEFQAKEAKRRMEVDSAVVHGQQ